MSCLHGFVDENDGRSAQIVTSRAPGRTSHAVAGDHNRYVV